MPQIEKCRANDVVAFGTRTLTRENFLRAPAQIARTGIQEYYAAELGFDKTRGMKAGDIVKLYRPPEEVFSADTIASFENQTLTMNHPDDHVDSSNWKEVTVGDFSGIGPKDNYLVADAVTVRDGDAVLSVIKGKSQLSCGYTFDADMTPGTTPDGAAYHGIMRNIRGNHLAIVDRARGGPGCRIGDGRINTTAEPEGDPTPANLKSLRVGDTELELDAVQCAVIDGTIKAANAARDKAVTDATGEKKRADDAVTEVTTLKAENAKMVVDHAAALKAANDKIPTEAQIEQLAEQRAVVVGDALALFPELKAAGKTLAAVRLEAVQHVATQDGTARELVFALLGVEDNNKAKDAIAAAAEDKIATAFVAARKVAGASVDDAAAAAAAARANDAATGRALGGNGSQTRSAPTKDGKPKLRGQDALRANLKGEAA